MMAIGIGTMHYVGVAAGGFLTVVVPGSQLAPVAWLPTTVGLVGCCATGLAIFFAITDGQLQRLSRSLNGSEERFRTLLDAAGEGILGLALDGTITFANPAIARMLDRPVEGLVGRRVCRRSARRSSSEWVDLGPSGRTFVAPLENLEGVSGSDHLRRPDGTLIPIDYPRPPLPPMGRVTGSVVTLSDAMVRARAQAVLTTARNEELDEALKAARATLGSTIARRLTEMTGGEMAVESQVGKGSTFSPTARVTRAANRYLAGPMDASSSEGPAIGGEAGPVRDDFLLNRRVLLVEDNSVNQAVGRAMLEKLGCRVDLAENGVMAITAYGRVAYDAILMDGQMPEMDGYETTRRLRLLESGVATEGGADRRLAHVPIIAMTAYAMRGDRERCLEAGMDDYLGKPFTRGQLSDVLHRCMADRPTDVSDTGEDQGRDASRPEGVVDDATLDELRALDDDGSEDSLRHVLTLYMGKSPQLITRLTEAVENGDAATLGQVAHSLKSASANVGATKLSTLCESLERIGELVQKLGYRPAIDNAGHTLAAIQAEYASVQVVLLKILADGAEVGSSQPIARGQ
jgi:CheY-like chemotaxis protein/PAS domain-containing protein